jgi:hypothetical protein
VVILAILLVVFATLLNPKPKITMPITAQEVDTPTQPVISSTPTKVIITKDMPSATSTDQVIITSESTLESTAWPFLPTVFVGTTGPHGFGVRWIAETCVANQNTRTVVISGAIISGNLIPYKFTFQQHQKVVVPSFTYFQDIPTALAIPYGQISPSERLVTFKAPIQIRKDRYTHVTIDFSPNDVEKPWHDDLLYLTKETYCPGS